MQLYISDASNYGTTVGSLHAERTMQSTKEENPDLLFVVYGSDEIIYNSLVVFWSALGTTVASKHS